MLAPTKCLFFSGLTAAAKRLGFHMSRPVWGGFLMMLSQLSVALREMFDTLLSVICRFAIALPHLFALYPDWRFGLRR